MGLYPLHNSMTLTGNASLLSSVFSSLSATVATTLPPVLLPTPSLTIPLYVFNTSVTPFPTLGQTLPIQSDNGNNSYTPLFTHAPSASPGLVLLKNASALPVINAPSSVSTVITTDHGETHTLTSTIQPIPTRILGLPPGTYSLNGVPSLFSKSELVGTSIIIAILRTLIVHLWT